ncbi:MAG: GNAT family N-acetyltransferase [Anaerolineae bacterium]|jgi:mycothiol synthase|nr:GNAT family N-acetyltransferase [Anaerolineae bacterium]
MTTVNEILLADAPAIHGLTFRRFRGESDFPRMAALDQACADADQVDDATTPEELANWFAHMTNCDPHKDMLFVEDAAGELIATCRNWWRREEATGYYIYGHSGRVSPKWRRRGIGRALLHHMQRRIREVIGEQGHPADAPRFFQTWAADTEVATEKLLTSEGYAPVRYSFEMTRPLVAGQDDIPRFPLPEGFEVRPVQPDQWRALFEADVEAFRDHWGFSEPTEAHFQGWIEWKWFRPELFRVAWDVEKNEIAGAVENFINEDENAKYNRKRGYTEGIFVRRPYRKRGLARALIALSLQMHKDLGMTEAALSVDAENLTGALRVYEACGFRVAKRYTTYRKAIEP